MKKIIASISFILSILILLVIGIIATESMLKADEKYNSLKGVGNIGLTKVTNISSNHTNDIIKNVYLGRYDNKTCYAFETTNLFKVTDELESNESIEIKMVVIISKYQGNIVGYKLSGKNSLNNKEMIHSNGMNDALIEDNLKILGISSSNEFNAIEGATRTSDAIKKCLEAIFEMYQTLKIEDNPTKLMNIALSKVGVTDGSMVDHSIITVSNKIKAIYTGKLDGKEVYVFDGIAPNQYENAVNHDINILIVIDKQSGIVLKTQVVGDFTYGEGYNITPNEFNMIGSSNIASFTAVTNATKSSSSVKEIFTAVFAAYDKIRGTK